MRRRYKIKMNFTATHIHSCPKVILGPAFFALLLPKNNKSSKKEQQQQQQQQKQQKNDEEEAEVQKGQSLLSKSDTKRVEEKPIGLNKGKLTKMVHLTLTLKCVQFPFQ